MVLQIGKIFERETLQLLQTHSQQNYLENI